MEGILQKFTNSCELGVTEEVFIEQENKSNHVLSAMRERKGNVLFLKSVTVSSGSEISVQP